MRLTHVNLLSAVLSLAGSIACLALGNVWSALVWFVASLIWVGGALYSIRKPATESFPLRRIARRLFRLALFS